MLSDELQIYSCDLLKIHYLCGDKDNRMWRQWKAAQLWFAQNSLPLRWQRQHRARRRAIAHRLWFAQNSLPLRWQRQQVQREQIFEVVVICSKFITFAVTKTTIGNIYSRCEKLWFAQNSLPLRWQRQPIRHGSFGCSRCDLLKIHYLCGDKDNLSPKPIPLPAVVICSKFITFAVTKTTLIWYLSENQRNVECIRNKKRCCQKRRTHG